MIFKKLALMGFVTLALVTTAQAKVWESMNTWDERWEDEYAQWVRTELQEDVFTRGPYAGISTDCADAVYAMRIIFSYQKKLPFAASGMTSNTTRFDDLSNETRRVRAFINYVAENTGTISLSQDTYPIAITPQSLKPGVVWIRSSIGSRNWFLKMFAKDVSRHTEVVKDVTATGVIYLMGSTVPSQVRNLSVTSSLMFAPFDQTFGLRRWTWPQNQGGDPTTFNNYSLEQFQMGGPGKAKLGPYVANIKARLATRAETREEGVARMAKDLCTMTHLRNEVVQDAIQFFKANPTCLAKNSSEYDEYSTPTRDKRMKLSLQDLVNVANAGTFMTSPSKKVERILPYFADCAPIVISDGRQLPMSDILLALAKKDLDSDPNQNELVRWGFTSDEKLCQSR